MVTHQSQLIIDCARIEAVARTVVAAKAGYNNLRQELVQAVVEFVRWRDVLSSYWLRQVS